MTFTVKSLLEVYGRSATHAGRSISQRIGTIRNSPEDIDTAEDIQHEIEQHKKFKTRYIPGGMLDKESDDIIKNLQDKHDKLTGKTK